MQHSSLHSKHTSQKNNLQKYMQKCLKETEKSKFIHAELLFFDFWGELMEEGETQWTLLKITLHPRKTQWNVPLEGTELPLKSCCIFLTLLEKDY